ncbi:MAG TPA: hypothetical protein PLB66_00060 [Bacteroidales bacterium]|nr:hypothetical protein [Bacteroidales bacterium]HOS57016.1 hypothetical protein [Bacteroidales bacterium]
MFRTTSLFIFLFVIILTGSAQNRPDCEHVSKKLSLFEKKIEKINTKDPEYIPLHYFLLLDIEAAIKNYYDSIVPFLNQCKEPSYYELITQYDNLSFRTQILKDSLIILKRRVDTLFYDKALIELQKENPEEALYFVNRALQYNRRNPDANILKLNLEFEKHHFEECIQTIRWIFNEVPLQRKHEMQLSDFNLQFYDTLFFIANSLLRQQREAEALELFKTLETFCKNMPTDYCNDDYYKGIVQSKFGVYESYIKIADVALERGYPEIAHNFALYAQQYVEENKNEIACTEELESLFKRISAAEDSTHIVTPEMLPSETDTSEMVGSELSCDSLYKQAIYYLLKQNYEQSLSLFSTIKSLKCDCTSHLEILIPIIEEERAKIK